MFTFTSCFVVEIAWLVVRTDALQFMTVPLEDSVVRAFMPKSSTCLNMLPFNQPPQSSTLIVELLHLVRHVYTRLFAYPWHLSLNIKCAACLCSSLASLLKGAVGPSVSGSAHRLVRPMHTMSALSVDWRVKDRTTGHDQKQEGDQTIRVISITWSLT